MLPHKGFRHCTPVFHLDIFIWTYHTHQIALLTQLYHTDILLYAASQLRSIPLLFQSLYNTCYYPQWTRARKHDIKVVPEPTKGSNTVMIGKSQNQPVNQIRRKLAWMRGSFLGRTLVSCGHFRYFPYIGRIFPQCIDTQPAIFFGIGIFYIFIPYGIQMKCIFLWIFHIPQYFFIPRAQIVFTGNSSRIIPYNFLIQVKRYFIPQ